ncbi:MAG TPA: Uma2 family endonuclease [Thermomicrobiales bacterium]|nr:Uma2 family endonuclease [Thermomicrobiales bacterium]
MAVFEIECLLQSPDATWSVERWEKLPNDGNRYEVIDGVLYMSTTPTVFHQWIVGNVVELVGISFHNREVAYALAGPVGVFISDRDLVQPDFLAVRRDRSHIIANGRINGAPDLIVEVISQSDTHHDTNTKRVAYARADVPEYWIVRPATRDIMVYWQPEPDFGDFAQSRLVAADGILESPTLPVSQRIADFFEGSPDSTL